MTSRWILAVSLVVVLVNQVEGENISIYVSPFYNSDGPVVQAGRFSEGLASQDIKIVEDTVGKMAESWDTLQIIPMYIVAIRLYDLGKRDLAVYWFYAAQHRSRLFQGALDPDHKGSIGAPGFEFVHAHQAFIQLAGSYINGYAFCDKDSFIETLKQVIADSKKPPDLKSAYPDIVFLEPESWLASSEKISEGLDKLVQMIQTDYDEIKAKRDQEGVTKEFCEN